MKSSSVRRDSPTPPNSVSRRNRVAELIRDQAPISRAEIARRLNVSPATAGRIVEALLQKDIVHEGGQFQAGHMGSPSTELRFNPQIASLLAVDLRLTRAYAAVTDLGGNILQSSTRQLDTSTPATSLQSLQDLITHLLDSHQGPPLRALILGVPSIVQTETGFIEWAPSLNWKDLPLGQIMHERFQLPILVENDVNLAALGEHWLGEPRESRNGVFVSIGSGIGAGIILNNEIYHGSSYAAGEVSYFVTDVTSLKDNAGLMGSLEQRAARDGVLQRSRMLAQRYPTSALADLFLKKTNIHASDIFNLAVQGDAAARVVYDETIDLISIVICNLAVVLDPQYIVIGGPSDWQWQHITESIQTRINGALLRSVNLRPSRLGRDAVVIGAAAAAIHLEGMLPR